MQGSQSTIPEAYLFYSIVSLFGGVAAVALGAPGWLALLAIVIAVLNGAYYLIARDERIRQKELKKKAEEEAKEKFKKEVAEAVKDTLKETIKVRCKYCGSLNDESASKCDSCGGSL